MHWLIHERLMNSPLHYDTSSSYFRYLLDKQTSIQFKILQPLSSWHRGTSCLWVQVMPFLHPGSLLWGQVKLLTLEKNLGRATRPGDEPAPRNKTKRRERNWVIVEAGPRLDYQLQITPPPRNYSFLGEVSRTRAKVALSSKYMTWNNKTLIWSIQDVYKKVTAREASPTKIGEAQFMTERLLKANYGSVSHSLHCHCEQKIRVAWWYIAAIICYCFLFPLNQTLFKWFGKGQKKKGFFPLVRPYFTSVLFESSYPTSLSCRASNSIKLYWIK